MTLPDLPPVPVYAEIDDISGAFTVRFDQILRPGPVAAYTLIFDTAALRFTGTTAAISGRDVIGTASSVPMFPPNPYVHYSANPPTLQNMRSNRVAPFANFPLTVL